MRFLHKTESRFLYTTVNNCFLDITKSQIHTTLYYCVSIIWLGANLRSHSTLHCILCSCKIILAIQTTCIMFAQFSSKWRPSSKKQVSYDLRFFINKLTIPFVEVFLFLSIWHWRSPCQTFLRFFWKNTMFSFFILVMYQRMTHYKRGWKDSLIIMLKYMSFVYFANEHSSASYSSIYILYVH